MLIELDVAERKISKVSVSLDIVLQFNQSWLCLEGDVLEGNSIDREASLRGPN